MVDSKSDTTVIVTTYNDSLSDLNCALSSVLKQTLLPREVIVVDDGSSNNTSEIVVQELCLQSPIPILLYRKENGGPSSARNYGLQYCSTEYVTFLDSDDEMLKNNIEIKEREIKKLNMSYFGVYGTHLKKSNIVHKYRNNDGFMDIDLIGKEDGLPGGVHTYLFRTCYLLDVGGFDETLVNNEDFDLVIRLIKKNLKAKGNFGPGFIKSYRYGSVSRNDQHINTYTNVQRFLKKAESNEYFSITELARRKAGSELWLGRRLLRKTGYRKQAIKHLNNAFDYSKPEGYKQYIAYLIAKIGSVVLWASKEI